MVTTQNSLQPRAFELSSAGRESKSESTDPGTSGTPPPGMRLTCIFHLLIATLLAGPAFGQSNTNCSNASALFSGVTNFVNTASVVSSGNPAPSCNSTLGRGVWYTITPNINERVNI